MPYKITKSDGTLLTTVADYTTDTQSTSLSLLGRGVTNYGQIMAENLTYLLENFASPTAPENPLVGQMWFQTEDNSDPLNPITLLVAKIYTGNTAQGSPAGWMEIGGTNASVKPPANPYVGELWYDLSNNTLYVWNGTLWSPVSQYIGEDAPTGIPSGNPPDGTQWLMMPEHMVWVFDSSISNPEPPFVRQGGTNDGSVLTGGWRLLGPQAPHNKGTYSAYAVVADINNGKHDVIMNYLDSIVVSVFSTDTFTMSTDTIPNYTTYDSPANQVNILPGINMNNGFKYSDGTPVLGRFNGTSTNSLKLGDLLPSEYLGRGDTYLPTIPASDNGADFGNTVTRWKSMHGVDICPGSSDVNNPDISRVNVWGRSQSAVAADHLTNSMSIVLSGDVLGTATGDGSQNFNISTSLSDALKKLLADMQAAIAKAQATADQGLLTANNALTQDMADNRYIQLTGTASRSVSGTIGSSTSNCFSTIYATTFDGTATHAEYSDLAEFYNGDIKYSYGTLLKIGGVNEVTQTTEHADVDFFGVVSHEPGFVMNNTKSGTENYVPVALSGRVPVRVIGKVAKGDRLVPSTIPGVACSAGRMIDILALDTTERTLLQTSIVGRALSDKTTDDEGIVECYVQAR